MKEGGKDSNVEENSDASGEAKKNNQTPVGIVQEMFDKIKRKPIYAFSQATDDRFTATITLEDKQGLQCSLKFHCRYFLTL